MGDASITKSVKKYKLVFIGDQSVGKTSIIDRFINDSFSGSKTATVGIDFVAKTLHMDNKTIRLQLWDTAGQERFRSLIPSYIRDSDAAIIAFDVTNAQSFTGVSKWLDYAREERGDGVLVILLANKIDMESERVVPTSESATYAKQQNIHYHEISAKDGTNVNEVFKNIANLLQGADKSDQTANEFDLKHDDGKSSTQKSGAIQLSSAATTDNKTANGNGMGKCKC